MKIKISGPFEMTPEVLEAKEERRAFLKEVRRKKQLRRRTREKRLLEADVQTLDLGQVVRRERIEAKAERQRLAQKARYEAKRELILAKAREQYAVQKEAGDLPERKERQSGPRTDAQKEANRKAQKEWRERNKEKVRLIKHEAYKKRKDELKAKAKQRYTESRDAILEKKYLDRHLW